MNKQELQIQLDQLNNQLKQLEAQFNQVLGAKSLLENLISKLEDEPKEKQDADTGSN